MFIYEGLFRCPNVYTEFGVNDVSNTQVLLEVHICDRLQPLFGSIGVDELCITERSQRRLYGHMVRMRFSSPDDQTCLSLDHIRADQRRITALIIPVLREFFGPIAEQKVTLRYETFGPVPGADAPVALVTLPSAAQS